MTSYLPFSLASSSTTPANDDVEVTVALSSDIYSNGEQVSATVRFQRPQPAKSQQSHERRSASPKLPKRLVRIGPKNVTSSRSLRAVQDGPYSPGADVQFRAPSIRSQMNHTRNDGRRTQSLAIGKNVSAQEMIWALGSNTIERRHVADKQSPIRIFWATAKLVGQFHPNNTYIPPDPLLPLRSLLLHQPVGSGSLEDLSPWRLGFGTGALGNSTQPSLTGSLLGLAKGWVKAGGSLEEERKRVWNLKDLPVFEPTKELLGVDVPLDQDFKYSVRLPQELPPSYKGKAFRFSYRLVINIGMPGGNKEIAVPVRVWGAANYDVLQPIIHRLPPQNPIKDEAEETLTKAVFDIAKDGRPVAALTLPKTVYRLGEPVIAVITMHRNAQKFCAMLETRETIPETLLPPGTKPPDLTRVHAEYVTSIADSAQVTFSLDIPLEATQEFSLSAGQGAQGGIRWGVRLAFWGDDFVDCQIPITVLRGNTNFAPKPSMHII